MESFAVDGFPETKIALALFKGVKNAAHLKSTYLNRVALVDAGAGGQKRIPHKYMARSNSFEMSSSIPRVSLIFSYSVSYLPLTSISLYVQSFPKPFVDRAHPSPTTAPSLEFARVNGEKVSQYQ